MSGGLQLEAAIREACLAEATARKLGNVHPQASFDDLTHGDFVASAEAAAPWLARAGELGVGAAILEAVTATRHRVNTNTNLGIALLIGPLAAVPSELPLAEGISSVLKSLTPADANAVYEAIRRAQPGGLGRVAQADVHEAPTIELREAMRLAAGRDLIAQQYVTDFALVLESARFFADGVTEERILDLQLHLLSTQLDSLILRKCGPQVAEEARTHARGVLQAGPADSETGRQARINFDAWLRADGHRRNPGTTADIIAASLFVAHRDPALPAILHD